MIFITNFYKLIVIILLIIILIKLINNINETFNSDCSSIVSNSVLCNKTPLCQTDTDNKKCISNPKIDFRIRKYQNNSAEIYWTKPIDKSIDKYILLYYINNNGPYLKIIDKDKTNYIFDNLMNNVKYKIGLIGVFDDIGTIANEKTLLTNLKDNIKEFSLSALNDDVKVKYINSFKTHILCDTKGQHRLIDKCPSNLASLNINAKQTLNDDEFNDDIHQKLMLNLNNKTPLHFKIEAKIN
jgi:hypothetical protein